MSEESSVIEPLPNPHSPPVQIAQALAPLQGLSERNLQQFADAIYKKAISL